MAQCPDVRVFPSFCAFKGTAAVDMVIPEVCDSLVGLCIRLNHLWYSSLTWRFRIQWTNRMKAPWKLLMMVNKYAMIWAALSIWKRPIIHVQPKMRSWEPALKVRSLVSLMADTLALTDESFFANINKVVTNRVELINIKAHTGPRKLHTCPVVELIQQCFEVP